MKKNTRAKFNAMKAAVASANGVQDVTEKFNLEPAVEQRLVEQMTHSSGFLNEINVVGVEEQKGQKLGLGVGSPIASRTDTKNEDRETQYVGSLENNDYECLQTNFDSHLEYRKIDAWAGLADFKKKYIQAVIKRMALDRIMVAWNGTSAAAKTSFADNPLLQDVNIGWLEKVRLSDPSRIMGYDSEGLPTADEFKVGEGGKYGTLDALAFDVTSSLLDEWHKDSDDLVLIIGRELWVSHGLTLYNDARAATERNALNVWFASELIAGLKTVMVPFFPSRGLVVTSYDNLSLYYQTGGTRRAIIDNPKRDRVEEYISTNDAYVVEDFGKFGGVRQGSILLKNESGEWV